MASSTPAASATLCLSAASSTPRWKHDVFLSFKGEDTRASFISHLHYELQNSGIRSFKDDNTFELGMGIYPTLKAIEESRFAIVVLSQHYASSPWCLDELTKIFQCMEDKDTILPVFYDVDSSDVRHQRGSFAEAFSVHEESLDMEKVQLWRTTLKKVTNLSGWDSKNYKSERELVQDIVKFLFYKASIKVESIDPQEDIVIESTISIKDVEATTQVMERTSATRSQRPYAFLTSGCPWKHDVYLSFRGEDTRKGLLSHLYFELQNRGIKAFKDEEVLELGTSIFQSLLEAIEQSRFAIVILSPNYAFSTDCLDELTKIFQIMEEEKRILPLFYHVNPSDVRWQKMSFGEALSRHENSGQHKNKVQQWRDALTKVASLHGWDSNNYMSERECVENIVEFLCGKVLEETALWNKAFEAARQPADQTPKLLAKPAPRWKHDVFLSFRGEDTRENILSHLYHELENTRGIKTFKDDQKLEKGTAISPNLLMAIEESRFAVIVLSANYASSTWCLEELTHILKCMGGKNTILPIFYHVDPSHVRKQEGSFAEAFTKHQSSGQDDRKMHQWREALVKVASFSGWHSNNHKSERDLVEDIGKFVWGKVVQVEVDSTMSMGDFEVFKATKQAMEQVMNALKNDKVNMIRVYGKGGVGKTTMVKHVSAQAQKIGLFDHVFTVFVSQIPDLRKIQGQLANMLGLNIQEETETEKATRLKKRIMRGHKILIILDNIWKSINLSSIGIPRSNELQRCSSKVLLITRKSDVCEAMGIQEDINLTLLSEEDSLNLFLKQSGKFESTGFYDAARKVAKQCAGLPIALIAVAKALRDEVDLDKWRKAARRLKKSQTANFDDEGDGFNCIKLSYDYLKGKYVKSCFLLCCLFPDDADIRIADLMEYGYGIGMFQYSNTMQEARATTHLAVIYLKACNLLMDGAEDGCIRMHDVIRNMALSILYKNGHNFFSAEKIEVGHRFLVKAGCQLQDWPMDANESHSAISVMRNKICMLPKELVCPKLQILLLQGNVDINDIPSTFFQSENAMRVLDLSDTRISSLSPSFSLLTNLRTLYLDGCKSITDVSALGELRELEILSMREFPLKQLPKEIGDLSHLKILDVSSEYVDTVPSEVVSRLRRLEELYMQCKFMDWGSKVKGAGNACFDELTGLSRLYILKVNISDAECLPKYVKFNPSWVIFDICVGKEPAPRDDSSKPYFSQDHSRTLILSTTINTLPDWFIMSATKKAVCIQYMECKDLKNMLVEYERGKLHELKYLTVIGCHEKLEELIKTETWIPVPSEPVFESLEELHLVGSYCLKELCVGELPARSLCNLKFLKVEGCPNLVNPLLPLIFCNLRVLMVKGCTKLRSLFTPDVARCFLQLEDLSVAQCPSLNRVIEAREEVVKKKITFPKLNKLVLCNLPQLTWFYCTGNATIYCPSLEHLYLQDCPQFSTSTSDFHTWKQVEVNDLRHLRTSKDEKSDVNSGLN